MQIAGQEITKDGLYIKIAGRRELYLGRDGVSVVDSMSNVIMTLSASQAAALSAEEDTIKTARRADRSTGWSNARGGSSRVSKEREFDRGYNEGGEGYNPYRHGAAKTYRR